MSVTCSRSQDDVEQDSPTTTAAPAGPLSPSHSGQRAILLADSTGVGYAVELPLPMGDPQLAIDAIYEQTPFIPHLKHAGKPTSYDTVEAFLNDHPDGEKMRSIIEAHFPHSS